MNQNRQDQVFPQDTFSIMNDGFDTFEIAITADAQTDEEKRLLPR